ncbi:aspartic peptidase domain-containing protein [Gongronella butleri]|nr:aspartic peptidase domain-containing protein [Gongronella butleri]
MKFLTTLAFATVLAHSASCIPIENTLSVPILINRNADPIKNIAHMRARYARHLMPANDHNLVARGPEDNDENDHDGGDTGPGVMEMANMYSDSVYYGKVQIGTPPQDVVINFDTGSADFWLASTMCPSCNLTTRHLYNPNASSTFEDDHRRWNMTYGNNATSEGFVGFDTLIMAGKHIKHQLVEVATNVSEVFQQSVNLTGLIGLGLTNLAFVEGTIVPVDNMIKQGLIKDPVFGVHLGRNNASGEFIFGGYNKDHIDGELTTVKVNDTRGFWLAKADSMSAGDQKVADASDVILDTGSSSLIFPGPLADQFAAIYNATPWQGGMYSMDCNTTGLPPFRVSLAGKVFEVPPESMHLGKLFNNGTCLSSVVNYGNRMGLTILGTSFLKYHYVVFDPVNIQFQIARSK